MVFNKGVFLRSALEILSDVRELCQRLSLVGGRKRVSLYHRVPLRARVAGRGEAVKKKNGESIEKNQVSRTKVTLRVTLYSVMFRFLPCSENRKHLCRRCPSRFWRPS